MKAWELSLDIIKNAVPTIDDGDEAEWIEQSFAGMDKDVEAVKLWFYSTVPGSNAPQSLCYGAISATENMGYNVSEAEALLPEALDAYKNNPVKLFAIRSKILNKLAHAPKIPDHPYHGYTHYDSFKQHSDSVNFLNVDSKGLSREELYERVHAGWLGQIAGAAIGTMSEGYCTDKLREKYGEIREYMRKPSTYNDDVLFELAFLEAFRRGGYDITSEDIALQWVERVLFAYSAEEIALNHLRAGVFPPESGRKNNPWREWIGAQMRGAICGMVSPGDAKTAASLAWRDGVISHSGNGVLAETFNAMLMALAYVENDVRELVIKTVELIPHDSEYYSVIKFALDACMENDSWEPAWRKCEEKFKRYHWIHAYPNAAAEIVALYFGHNSFKECMHVIAMCGMDVDCNAGQIGTIYGLMQGYKGIPTSWTAPFEGKFDSLMRGYEHTTISALAKITTDAVYDAGK